MHISRRSLLGGFAMAPAFAEDVSLGSRQPVVAELFTSEGCSSCPPADQLLIALHEEQPLAGVEIIALSEHVDYWNRLGWTDPFSSRQFSERQHWYAQRWEGRVYTPQLVIDGRYEMVGSDVRAVEKAILKAAEEPKIVPRIEVDSAGSKEVRLRIAVPERMVKGSADLYVALIEDKLETVVPKGENRGRTLPHSAVARRFEKAAIILPTKGSEAEGGHQIQLKSGWERKHLRVAVFIQHRKSGHILGASSRAIVG